jgi:hypothetical protein
VVARQFSKPPEARQLEARARARSLGVRVAVVVEAGRYVSHSRSEPGVVHTLQRTRDGWCCSCRGYTYTGCCRHLGALERRASREGWPFGTICPLAKAPAHFPLETDQPPAPAAIAPADARARGRQALADLYEVA